MRALAIFVIFSIVSCKSNAPSSEIKQTINGDSVVAHEDESKSGICLVRDRKSSTESEKCSETTYKSCRSQSTRTQSAVFVSSAGCKCYALEQKFLAELNKDPYVDDSEIASDASNPIEIGGGWDKFYEEHPECKVSAENDLLP